MIARPLNPLLVRLYATQRDSTASPTSESTSYPDSSSAATALTNARRYAARETTRHLASTAPSLSSAAALPSTSFGRPWERRPTAWDNFSASDASRRRSRIFSFFSRPSLDVPDNPEWHSTWRPPYTIDLRPEPTPRPVGLLGENDPRLGERSGIASGQQGGSLPTVVVTSWENEVPRFGPMDDTALDNELEEVS